MAARHTTRTLLAVLAVLLAVPSMASAASITVTKHTTNGDRATGFAFVVTGPRCDGSQDIPGTSQRIDMVLVGGQSRTLTLCDTPPEKAKRFAVTEAVPAGWRLDLVVCSSTDRDPADAFIVEPPSVFVELSPSESKACVFTDSPVSTPPAPPAVATPPAPAPPAAAPPAVVPPTVTVGAPPVVVRHHRKVCRYGRVVIKDRHHHRATKCKAAPRRVRRAHPKPSPQFTG